MRFLAILLSLVMISTTAYGVGSLLGKLLHLEPQSLPNVCRPGDIRVDSDDSNKIKVCTSDDTWQDSASASGALIDPMTTRGDMIYQDASGEARLAVGTTDQVMVTDGTDPSWSKISNANVDAAAAIDGTKVAPDFGSQTITTTGNLEGANTVLSDLSTGNRILASHATNSTLVETGLNTTESAQLENIDSVTISNTQWGYLGGLDQALSTTDSPDFGGGGNTISSTQYGHLGALDQGVSESDDVRFNSIVVTGTAVSAPEYTITGLGTETAVLFLNGAGLIDYDDSNFSWDTSENSLGIGTNSVNSDALLELDSTTKGLLMPRMTTTQRDNISTPSEGNCIWNTTDSQYNCYNGTAWGAIAGGGGASNSVIMFDDFETEDDSNLVAYDDGAAEPVDLTGGTVDGITISEESTNPLGPGDNSYKFAKDAADRQGEGAAITSDNLYRLEKVSSTSPIIVSFAYETSADYASDDLEVWIYRVGSNTIEKCYGVSLLGSGLTNGLSKADDGGQFSCHFNASSSDTSFRIGWHVASTNASAYDVVISRIDVDTQQTQPGTIVTEWEGFTPDSTQGFGTISSNNLEWRRNGPNMEIRGDFITGTMASSEAQIELPEGKTIAGTSTNAVVAGEYRRNVSATAIGGTILATNGDNFLNFADRDTYNSTSANPLTPANGDDVAINSERVSFNNVSVPIEGWDAGGVLGDTEININNVEVSAAGNGGTSITADTTDVDFTETKDKLEIWDGTTLTAPVKGRYGIKGQIALSGANTFNIDLYINGSKDRRLASPDASTATRDFSVDVDLEKDDEVTIRIGGASPTLTNSTDRHWLEITGQPSLKFWSQLGNVTEDVGLFLDSGNGHGSSGTKVRRFSNERKNTLGGHATYTDSSTNGAGVEIHTPGNWAIRYGDSNSGGDCVTALTVNPSSLTTNASNLTYAQGNRGVSIVPPGDVCSVSDNIYLEVGDVVRPMDNGSNDRTDILSSFSIRLINPAPK